MTNSKKIKSNPFQNKKNYFFDGYNKDIDLSDLDEEITFVEKALLVGNY